MQGIKRIGVVVGLVGISFLAGYWVHKPAEITRQAQPHQSAILYYHDPMHPAYKSDKPGIAPDCGMQLEPVYAEGASSPEPNRPGTVRLSAAQQELIGLHTEPVSAQSGAHSIRVVGKIAADETRVNQITALADGVVRRVSPYAAGSLVRKDDLLATYFVATRDLFNAMQAFVLVAGKLDTNLNTLRNGGVINTSKSDARVEEELLQSYGVTSAQIREMVRTREVTRDIDFRAPWSGVVLDRNIAPGSAVTKGAELFRIADLSHIWVLADVFEGDADKFHPGAVALVTYAGRPYHARVTEAKQFDPNSRTLKIRLEMDNPGMVLRPEMFVNVQVDANEGPGLSVPADSVVDDGRTRMVFVSSQPGVYEPRAVTTGLEYNGRVQVLGGLKAGESVVSAGTFLLDSESRLQSITIPAAASLNEVSEKKSRTEGAAVLSKDPVCGMPLSGKAEQSSVYHGARYGFCSKDCKDKFDQNPSVYIGNKSPDTSKDGAQL
jgi:membrane fusion protein, copper/silver efflux system